MSAVMQEAMQEAGRIPAEASAVEAEVVEAAEAKPHKPRKPKAVKPEANALTATWLQGFLADVAQAAPSREEQTKMATLFAMFKVSGTDTVKDATKGLTEGMKRETHPEYAVRHKQASEIRTLYGAFRYVPDFKPAGYKASVEKARASLKELHLDWQGGRVKTAAEKKVDQATETDVAVFKAERKAFHDAANRGLSPAEVQAAADAAKETAIRELGKAQADKLAKRICEKYDADFVEQLIDCLMNRLSGYGPVATQDSANQAE